MHSITLLWPAVYPFILCGDRVICVCKHFPRVATWRWNSWKSNQTYWLHATQRTLVICTLGNLQAVIFLTCESIDINLITEVIKKARTHSHFMATSLVYEGQHSWCSTKGERETFGDYCHWIQVACWSLNCLPTSTLQYPSLFPSSCNCEIFDSLLQQRCSDPTSRHASPKYDFLPEAINLLVFRLPMPVSHMVLTAKRALYMTTKTMKKIQRIIVPTDLTPAMVTFAICLL